MTEERLQKLEKFVAPNGVVESELAEETLCVITALREAWAGKKHLAGELTIALSRVAENFGRAEKAEAEVLAKMKMATAVQAALGAEGRRLRDARDAAYKKSAAKRTYGRIPPPEPQENREYRMWIELNADKLLAVWEAAEMFVKHFPDGHFLGEIDAHQRILNGALRGDADA